MNGFKNDDEPSVRGRIEIDLRTEGLTAPQMAARIMELQRENPDREYWVDGDAMAVLSRPIAQEGC